MNSLKEMKKMSYWFSIAFGVVLGLLSTSLVDSFNIPNKAINYEETQYDDTLLIDANGKQYNAVILNGAIWNGGQSAIEYPK